MQVILLKDIPKVGRKFDVVDVADGYAMNMLLPKQYAERATSSKVAELEKRKEASKAAEDARRADLAEKLESLKDTAVTIAVKADDRGHLYKKIHKQDIAAVLEDDHDIKIDADAILLDAPLHEIGEHTVSVDAAGTKIDVSVSVVAE